MASSTLLLPLLMASLLLVLVAHGAVHRFDVTHERIPRPSHGLHPHARRPSRAVPGPPRPNLEAVRRQHQAEIDFHTGKSSDNTLRQLTLTDIVSTQPIDVDDYGWTLMVNVTLGTPAQSFRLMFDFPTPSLYVIDANAQYYNPWASSSSSQLADVSGKQTYDSSASSSYAASNGNFSYNWPYLNGSVASDTLTVGSLTATVSFEDTSLVRSWLQYHPYDGVFGLSTIPDVNASTTLLGQLQSSLDIPVYTFNMVYTKDTAQGSGQFTLGGLAPDTCQGDWILVANTSGQTDYGFPYFQATSISTTTVGDTSGCAYGVNIPTYVYMDPGFGYMHTSAQMMELFVQASNATFNFSSWQYELTPDQLAAAQPVFINLATGGTIRLDPDDYTDVSSSGVNYLNVYGSYDAHKYNFNYITLGMSFLNNHCVSKNFQTGIWSVSNTVRDTEIVDDPSTTTQGPSTVSSQ